MAKKISQLPAAGALTGAELAALVQGGDTVQSTAQAIANLFAGGNMGAALNWKKFGDIASAATADIGAAAGNFGHITGTTTITALGTAQAGSPRLTVFDGALTLTHNATSLILLTGANITTAAGDFALWVSEGSGNWRMAYYQRNSGQPLVTGTSQGTVVSALSIASGVVNIDCALGDLFTLALTANVTSITFSNLPAAGRGQSIGIRLKQDGTGSRAVALPASFKAITGSDVAVQSAANAYTILHLETFDQGTRWEYSMKAGAA